MVGRPGFENRDFVSLLQAVMRGAEADGYASVIEVMPLASVRMQDGETVTFNDGRPGEVTRRLMAAYSGRVASASR